MLEGDLTRMPQTETKIIDLVEHGGTNDDKWIQMEGDPSSRPTSYSKVSACIVCGQAELTAKRQILDK